MIKRNRRSEAEWQRLIKQQRRSNLSVLLFCQQQGLSSKTFYKRRRTLQQKTAEPFIKIKPKSAQATATQTTAVLHYQNSWLQLPTEADATWVAQLMQALA